MTEDQRNIFAAIAVVGLLSAVAGFGIARYFDGDVSTESADAEANMKPAKDTVALTPEQIAAANIMVSRPLVGSFGSEIVTQASVVPAPAGVASLTAHASGSVTRIFKRLGDPVKRGEVLAVVEGRDAAQIAADRSAAGAKATFAERVLAREKSLFEQGVSSRASYEQAEAEAAAAMAETRRAQSAAGSANVTGDGRGVAIVSPIEGSVTASSAKLGAFVQSETELFQVSDPRRIQIEAAISPDDIARIIPGDRAVIETPDKRTIEARVSAVTPALDATTRVATAILDSSDASLRAGQVLRVRIIPRSSAATAGMSLPDEAVQTVEGRSSVFIRTPTGFAAKAVLTGRRSAGPVARKF